MRRGSHARDCSESDRAKGAALATLALLVFIRGRHCAKATPSATETVEPKPTKPDRSGFGEWLHSLTKPIRRQDQPKWRKEDEERAAREAEEKKGAAPSPTAEKDSPQEEEAKKDEGEGSLTGIVVKVLGAIATGIGVTGAVVVVGAAIVWARFDAIGVAPVQAVTAIPRTELLVQGAQEMVIFVLIGLGAVLLIALVDPKGVITRGTLLVLAGLVLGVAIFAITTELSWAWVLGLVGLALILALATIGIGFTTGQRLVPLLVGVFIASFVFSASCAFLIVEKQRFAQAIAIHFGPNGEGKSGKGEGITGVYITATEKTLFYARTPANGSDEVGLYEIPRSDVTTYAVGPLESIEKVEGRARALLANLKTDAESLPPPVKAPSGE